MPTPVRFTRPCERERGVGRAGLLGITGAWLCRAKCQLQLGPSVLDLLQGSAAPAGHGCKEGAGPSQEGKAAVSPGRLGLAWRFSVCFL